MNSKNTSTADRKMHVCEMQAELKGVDVKRNVKCLTLTTVRSEAPPCVCST